MRNDVKQIAERAINGVLATYAVPSREIAREVLAALDRAGLAVSDARPWAVRDPATKQWWAYGPGGGTTEFAHAIWTMTREEAERRAAETGAEAVLHPRATP